MWPSEARVSKPSRRDDLRRRISGWFPVRVATRYIAISGYDRALALATQAFVALVPMLIIVAAALPEHDRATAGGYLTERLQLSGSAADDLHQLVQRPPQPTEPITLVGVVVLVVSVLGFTRTLQRTYQAAWRLSPQGVWGYVYGLLGAAALVGEVVVVVLVGLLIAGAPGATVLVPALRLLLSVLMWWPVQWLLLGRRVGWRRLLPGAVLLGIGQMVVIALSGAYLQWAIESQAKLYGLIGVVFVLVSWLIALGLLIVLAAVLSAESAPGAPQPQRVPSCPVGAP
jgi:membrane protein